MLTTATASMITLRAAAKRILRGDLDIFRLPWSSGACPLAHFPEGLCLELAESSTSSRSSGGTLTRIWVNLPWLRGLERRFYAEVEALRKFGPKGTHGKISAHKVKAAPKWPALVNSSALRSRGAMAMVFRLRLEVQRISRRGLKTIRDKKRFPRHVCEHNAVRRGGIWCRRG